ncbi:MAG: carboxypeptidase regulatory-like domain-containing protein, partial [Deltaproteobacteria bacterium]|nr:carboxypeptidase regulatory-like domain-containing protein [Deltaproteobacteria bacterium]
ATNGDLVGSLEFNLTAKSGPAVIHVTAGVSVEVTVVDQPGKPIAGASVHEGGEEEPVVVTDAKGTAKLKGIKPGWIAIDASAPGYAPSKTVTTIGSSGGSGTVQLTLRKGYAVAGKVVDDAGKPVVSAKVSAVAESWGTNDESGDADVITNARGEFQIPALSAGTHRLAAIDGEHAPAWSTPLTIKDAPITGVVITMKAGGVLAGKVTDAAGKPVGFASVQVVGKGEDGWQNMTPRHATTDKLGAFELRGLARVTLQARAELETAASKILEVDLSEKLAVTDVTLVLDVSGQISGIVVDDAGAPIPEIQVNAFPDVLGGASMDGLALAGLTATTTDGGGAFVISGLPDGAYRLHASRGRAGWSDWGQGGGTSAKTGDTAVKIVLPAPGVLTGKVLIAGSSEGGIPTIASVQVGQKPPTPLIKGEFTVRDLTPGNYDVTFRGIEFTETTKRDIKIEAGKTLNLGTVSVTRGRRLTGKVVDSTGQVIAGAKIRVAEMLFSSNDDDSNRNEGLEGLYGIRSTATDQAGEFVIIGVPKKATSVLADHPDLGRSDAMPIAAGNDDPPPLTLTLRGYGSITGKVTMKGKPVPKVAVSAAATGGGAAAAFAQSDDEGVYTITKVPEGPQVVQAMKTGMMEMKTGKTTTTVTAGKQATVNIEIPVGEVALTVTIKALPNHKVDAAQVFLFAGTVAISTGKQLTDNMFQGAAQGMKLWLG